MLTGSVQQVELVFLLLLLFVVAFGALAKKLQVPYPIVLVVAGLLLGFVPGIPRISLNPDIVFFVVLPPLLYSAAWLTSWRDFHFHMVSILLLAFGLVAFTVWGVAQGGAMAFYRLRLEGRAGPRRDCGANRCDRRDFDCQKDRTTETDY